jgi:hypothetical protein
VTAKGLPPGARFDDYVQVAEAAQAYEAELIAGRLRASGVDVHVLDQSFHLEPMPTVRNFNVVRVLVHKDQADEARRVLAEPAPPLTDAEADTPDDQ